MTAEPLFSVDEALAHLRGADPVLAGIIDRASRFNLTPGADGYTALLYTILAQQLAAPAARTIRRRLFALHGDEGTPPRPEQLLAMSDDDFRGVGVSRQKAGYLRDLALHVVDQRLDFQAMRAMDDEAVIEAITGVKGLGEWSAHMFLMFQLGRPDVLPVGDLGVRNGMRAAYGLAETPAPARAREIGAPWAPFRSVGSWYMWRVLEPAQPEI